MRRRKRGTWGKGGGLLLLLLCATWLRNQSNWKCSNSIILSLSVWPFARSRARQRSTRVSKGPCLGERNGT